MIDRYERPLGVAIISCAHILSGIAGFIVSTILLLNASLVSNLIAQSVFLNDVLFYLNLSPGLKLFWLTMQLLFSGLLFSIGILLLRKKLYAFHLSRIFLPLLTALFILNPHYPDKLLFVFTPLFGMTIFYLFHHKFKIYFYDIPKDYIFLNKNFLKSRLTVLFSSIELIGSLLLLRTILWTLPLSGLTLASGLNKNLTLIITIPKVELILLSIIILTASLLTLTYRPIGRMLNILLCFLGLIFGIFHIFFLQQPVDYVDKLHFLMLTTGVLVFSFIYYFLLINPTVKGQFKKKADLTFAPRIIGLLSFGIYCFTLLLFLRITSSYLPCVFENSLSTKKLQIENPGILSKIEELKSLLKDSSL